MNSSVGVEHRSNRNVYLCVPEPPVPLQQPHGGGKRDSYSQAELHSTPSPATLCVVVGQLLNVVGLSVHLQDGHHSSGCEDEIG